MTSAATIEHLAADANARFGWGVVDTATPVDRAERLLALGLEPNEGDPVFVGMVLEHEPTVCEIGALVDQSGV